MASRKPAKDAIGEWRAVPKNLPRAWFSEDVTPYARMLGLELFRRCDDDYQGIVVTNDPWTDDICKSLEIGGPHRNAAKAALRCLVKAGLVRPLKGRLFIEMGQTGAVAEAARNEPISNSDRTQLKPPLNPTQITCESRVNQQSTQPVEIVDITKHREGKAREVEGREGSRAREADTDPRFGPIPQHALAEARQKRPPSPQPPSKYEPPKPATVAGRLVESAWQNICLKLWISKSWEPADVCDGLGEALVLSARESGNTLESVVGCGLYRFAVLCKAHNSNKVPALRWLFHHGKLSQCLHEGADNNPPAYRMVAVVEALAGAAQ